MKRREFIKGLSLLAACPLCATPGFASESKHWGYEGETGPDHWGAMSNDNLACSAGSQQSPIDITGALKAELPGLKPDWKAGGGTIVNNGHTLQVNMPAGSTLTRGDKTYDLLQFHFHAPSEHLVKGKNAPMEVHFVHKNAATGDLGVVGVFFVAGATNTQFADLAAAFPAHAGAEVAAAKVDPSALLPAALDYWAYEGSLTTPPCSEVVDWMVVMQPLEVAAEDIARFTALYNGNARPALPANRRFILGSS